TLLRKKENIFLYIRTIKLLTTYSDRSGRDFFKSVFFCFCSSGGILPIFQFLGFAKDCGSKVPSKGSSCICADFTLYKMEIMLNKRNADKMNSREMFINLSL